MNYQTLDTFNQGSQMNPGGESGFNNPYNHRIEGNDFDNLNSKYSRKEMPGNVQNIINKMSTKKGI